MNEEKLKNATEKDMFELIEDAYAFGTSFT